MTISLHGNMVSLAVMLALLAGCEGGPGPAGRETADVSANFENPVTQRGRRGSSQDVEAPGVFSTTDEGLWDGRPSLGGIWVASPDATTPERVRISNSETGKSVNGALFRRERENPGPKLQLSSDAASALGMLAGAPATIKVVALRRQDQVAEESPEAVAEGTPSAVASGEEVASGTTVIEKPSATGEAAKVAAAAVAAIGATATGAKGAAEAGAVSGAVSGEAAAAAPQPRRGLFGGLFGRQKSAAPAADPEAAPLSTIDRAAGDEPSESGSSPTAPANATATMTATSGSTVSVVIGAFGVEGNAMAALKILQDAGFAGEITLGKLGEKPIWTVSAKGAGDKATVLKTVQDLGYKDAYLD